MFLTGPARRPRGASARRSTHGELGGPDVHERNGVCQFVAPQRRRRDLPGARAALATCRQNALGAAPGRAPAADRAAGRDPARLVPAEPRARLRRARRDPRGRGRRTHARGRRPRWARNMVTAFARIEGRPVGIVANQPRYLGGVIDAEAAQKAARFVRTCNAFGLPLVVLVDTPGFLPGTRQERRGVIRHGAEAPARVRRGDRAAAHRRAAQGVRRRLHHDELRRTSAPTSRSRGRGAEIGIMGAQAGGRHRPPARARRGRRPRGAPRPAGRRVRGGAPRRATAPRATGFIDEVIEPTETRERLARGLTMLSRREGRRGDAGNIPL